MAPRRSVTVVSPTSSFRTRQEARRIAKALGLPSAERASPDRLREFMQPRMHEVYLGVVRAYRNLLNKSSLYGGPFNRAGRPNGVRFTGSLYNALEEVPFAAQKRGRGVLRGTWGIVAKNPPGDPYAFDRADQGWTNAQTPNLTALFEWAKVRFHWAVPTPQGGDFFGQLQGYKVPLQGGRGTASVGYLFWRFVEAVRGRRYQGLQLRENLAKAVEKNLVKVAKAGGSPLAASELLRILRAE